MAEADATHLQPVGQDDVGVHGPHIQVVDKRTLNSVGNFLQGSQLGLDFLTDLWGEQKWNSKWKEFISQALGEFGSCHCLWGRTQSSRGAAGTPWPCGVCLAPPA